MIEHIMWFLLSCLTSKMQVRAGGLAKLAQVSTTNVAILAHKPNNDGKVILS